PGQSASKILASSASQGPWAICSCSEKSSSRSHALVNRSMSWLNRSGQQTSARALASTRSSGAEPVARNSRVTRSSSRVVPARIDRMERGPLSPMVRNSPQQPQAEGIPTVYALWGLACDSPPGHRYRPHAASTRFRDGRPFFEDATGKEEGGEEDPPVPVPAPVLCSCSCSCSGFGQGWPKACPKPWLKALAKASSKALAKASSPARYSRQRRMSA